ncbi:MAG: DNA primase [Phycisphaerales bacterium]|jgi:DNA primase
MVYLRSHQDGMSDDRLQVRDASDIVDIVGEVVNLQPKGREFVGLCPFHEDHKPSMAVVPHKQMYHCFSCGAGGDVFTFVQEFHKMGFREALEMLAEKAGIELTKFNGPKREPGALGRVDLSEANTFANRFYQSLLSHEEHGAAARGVIERRGISPEMVERFELGVSPDRWDGLGLKIKSAQLSEEAFVGAGLLKTRDSGGSYDALRNRLIFPIQDQTGKTIAFGGRIIAEDDEPKYLNSPETLLFNKSQTLYGLPQALAAIKREKTTIIVEGYTDVIACHQAGIENVVGTLGTALTPGHARVLRRLCETIVLLFDGDEAGQKAAGRGMERLLDELVQDILFRTEGAGALDIRFASLAELGDAKDPDELLKTEGGADRLRELIKGAPDLLQFRYAVLGREMAERGASGKERVLTAEIERLTRLGVGGLPQSRKITIARLLAEATGLDVQLVLGMLPSERNASRVEIKPVQPASAVSIGARELALGCLMARADLWRSLSEAQRDLLDVEAYPSAVSRTVADTVMELGCDGEEVSLGAVQAAIGERDDENEQLISEARLFASRVHLKAEQSAGGDTQTLTQILSDCLWQLERADLGRAIRAENDSIEKMRLTRRLHERKSERTKASTSRAT